MGERSRVPVLDGHVVIHRSPPIGAAHGRCLVVPPFGVPARWLSPLTDAISHLGMEAISFDPRDHVGDGSGTINDYRVSQVAEDCAPLIDEVAPTCVLAVSLGARGALRALARSDAELDIVLVTPVVALRSTLSRILGRDWFAAAVDELPQLMPVLDHEVCSQTFRSDCLEHGFLERDGTVADLAAARGRIHLIAGSADPWIDRNAVVATASEASAHRDEPVTVETVDADRHLLHEDADLAMRMIDAAVAAVAHRRQAA